MTFDSCTGTPESPNALLSSVFHTRNLSETLPFHDKGLTPHTDAIIYFGCRVLPHPFCIPDLSPPDCHLSGPYEKSLKRHHYANDKPRGTAESRAPMFVEKGQQLLPREEMFLFQVGRRL